MAEFRMANLFIFTAFIAYYSSDNSIKALACFRHFLSKYRNTHTRTLTDTHAYINTHIHELTQTLA